jgi:hypothetical protein
MPAKRLSTSMPHMRLAETNLELVGDEQDLKLIGLEGIGDMVALQRRVQRLTVLSEAVRPEFRVPHLAGKGDNRADISDDRQLADL